MEDLNDQNARRTTAVETTGWYGWMVGLMKRSGLCTGEMHPPEPVGSAAKDGQAKIDGGNERSPPCTTKDLPQHQDLWAENLAAAEIIDRCAGDLEHVAEAKYVLLKSLNECALRAADDYLLHDNRMTCSHPSEVISYQIDKYNQMRKEPKVLTETAVKMPTNYADPEDFYVELKNKIDKCKNTLDKLSSEKESLVKTNRNLASEINDLRLRLATVKRNGRKYCANKNDINVLKTNVKNLKSRTAKDLDDIKSVLRAIEKSYAIKDLNKEQDEKIVRQYDKLKIRLQAIEKDVAAKSKQTLQEMMVMPTSCLNEGVNESVTPLHNETKVQQKPNAPPAPPPPPPPPVGSLATSVQYPRYSISTDILKEMTQELRKPDSNNVRKIPMRADMKISCKIAKNADQVQPPALPTAEAPPVTSESSENPLPSNSPTLSSVL